MPPTRFDLATPASDQPQTLALYRSATGISTRDLLAGSPVPQPTGPPRFPLGALQVLGTAHGRVKIKGLVRIKNRSLLDDVWCYQNRRVLKWFRFLYKTYIYISDMSDITYRTAVTIAGSTQIPKAAGSSQMSKNF